MPGWTGVCVSGAVIDLRSGAALLRRGWRVLVVAGVAGLVLGGGYALVMPPSLRSTTLLLLSTSGGGQGSSRPIDTQVAIATSFGVSRAAGESLHPALSAEQVTKQVTVDAPTDQLLRIEATAGRAADAEALSYAVADYYLATVRDTTRSIGEDLMTDLRGRQSGLEKQVAGLQTEIDAAAARVRSGNPNSVDGRRDAQLLASLRAGQADLSLQLDKVKDQMVSSQAQGPSSQITATLIQKPSPAGGPSLAWRLLVDGSAGAGAVAGAAAVALLVRARRDPRLRRRDDLADAVGSHVVAAVRSEPAASVAAWSSLLDRYEPDPVDAWALRQTLREAVPRTGRAASRDSAASGGRAVSVVVVSGDPRGLAVAVRVAVFATSLGLRTRLVPAVRDDAAASLWAACAERAATPREPDHGLLVASPVEDTTSGDETTTGDEIADEQVDLTVVLLVVDASEPDVAPAAGTAATVLVVSPGTATQADLARLAVALDAAGRRVDAVVVADPDAGDTTTGGHRLGERLRRAGRPVRLNGTSPAAGARS